MNTTKKLALKDRTIAAAKANEVKGGPIYVNITPNNNYLIGLLHPANPAVTKGIIAI